MKKDQDKQKKSSNQELPPEISPTVPSEISSSIEAMKEVHKSQEEIVKQQWEEKRQTEDKKEKNMFKRFYQNITKGEGPNPILKKRKSIGGVRGKFHPSKKGKDQ